MMRLRSIAAATALRTRTSSNGGRDALNTMPLRQQHRVRDHAQGWISRQATPSSARSRRRQALRSRGPRTSSWAHRRRRRRDETLRRPAQLIRKVRRALEHPAPARLTPCGTGTARCRRDWCCTARASCSLAERWRAGATKIGSSASTAVKSGCADEKRMSTVDRRALATRSRSRGRRNADTRSRDRAPPRS
jgi:hypothetical protein